MRIAGDHTGVSHWEKTTMERLECQGQYNVNVTFSRPRGGVEDRPGVEREHSVGHYRVRATSTREAGLATIERIREAHAWGKISSRWLHITVTCKAPDQKIFRTRTEL